VERGFEFEDEFEFDDDSGRVSGHAGA